MSSFYLEFSLAGLFLWINEEDYMKKREILKLYEKNDNDYDDSKLQDIIELTTFIKTENETQQQEDNQTQQQEDNQNQIIENEVKHIDIILGDEEPEYINPDIFTPVELQMLFCIIPLDVITKRINDISNKVYKIKGLNAFIFDKNIYKTLIIFNQEIHTELKSEFAISFAKLILSRIPQKYIINL